MGCNVIFSSLVKFILTICDRLVFQTHYNYKYDFLISCAFATCWLLMIYSDRSKHFFLMQDFFVDDETLVWIIRDEWVLTGRVELPKHQNPKIRTVYKSPSSQKFYQRVQDTLYTPDGRPRW